MNEEALLFAHAVRAAVSQRLVRRLCGSCRQLYIPTRDEAVEMEKAFGIHSPAARQHIHQLEKQAFQTGMGDRHLSTNMQGIAQLWRANEDGCEACNHTGFRGTVAIVEVLPTQNNETQTALLTTATAAKLRRTAIKEHFIPMELDGLVKVLRGQTTATELLRTLSI
jgi:type IV pilus assembly protein PilB